MVRKLLLSVSLCAALTSGAFATDVVTPASDVHKVYNAQTAVLDNGMEIVVVPIHRTPAVTHMVWYKAGAGEEKPGAKGVAHFLEHLMFKGTPHIPTGKFSEIIQQMGGDDNAFTSWDYTAYYQIVPKDKLADVMRMESERMNDMTPPFKEIVSEKEVVIEERRQNVESSPAATLGEKMRDVLFEGHPYGNPILGRMEQMQKLKWIDALQFYKHWYAPNNAILVVSGDVTLADVLPLAQATYGALPKEDVPQRARPDLEDLKETPIVTHTQANVRQPLWEYMVRAPAAHQAPQDSLALDVLADLLAGPTGNLYQELVVKEKIATSINAGYDSTALDDGSFMVYAVPADGVDMKKLGDAVTRVLKDIGEKGFTDAEVKNSIARQQDEAVYALDSLAGPAMTIGYALASGERLDDIETWPTRLESVTPAQVKDALNKYVLGRKGITGYLLPPTAEKTGGKDAQ
ncbi:MAG TPA: pitrilysin family protein [Alphaproteobacteria bacterium]